ncbi:MAG: dihydrofolate reductase [Bacteroidales bacterium]|nr:dihydrofolate reductase [Bacteroidales bacterium]
MKDILSLIGAAAENDAIGYRGLIPWHIRADFQYFKRTTMGHPVIMGLATWRSFNERCLPGRRNLVVTDQPLTEADKASGAEFFRSPDEALEAAAGSGEIFIIGGGMMYRQMIVRADRVYVTRIHTVVEPADAFFPPVDPDIWQEIFRSIRYHDEESGYDYTFLLYERRK